MINVILHEPDIPQNTGNIARTCVLTNAQLHLIRPLGFELSDKYLKRAGLDYWQDLQLSVWDNLADCLDHLASTQIYYFSSKVNRSYTEVNYLGDISLLFGKETKGLDLKNLADVEARAVRIPMQRGKRSLNLSNAVAIAVYEALRQQGFSGLE